MLYLFFAMMLVSFLAAIIALPVVTAPYVPWWGTLAIILGELIFLRYTLFKIIRFMFAMFVFVGLRFGAKGMRGAKVDFHSVTVVPEPGPDLIVKRESGSIDEDEEDDDAGEEGEELDENNREDDGADEADAPDVRYVRVDCTVTPSAKSQASNWPLKHYEAGAFTLSSKAFTWPTFPPQDDETRTGTIVAAALLNGDGMTPIPLDRHLLGSQRLALYFKCPATLQGRAKLKFLVLPLASLDLP
jgi:hypothetical protein